MLKHKGIHFNFIGLFLALTITTALSGCYSGGDDYFWIDTDGNLASAMTKAQSADATSGSSITLLPDSASLTLNGVIGKTLYMTRTNAVPTALPKNKQRIIESKTGISSSLAQNLENFNFEDFNFEIPAESKSVTEKLYDFFLSQRGKNSISKSVNNQIQASVARNYNVGDTATFYSTNPQSMANKDNPPQFDTLTYKLLATGNDYNIWVNTADPYYTEKTSDFTAKAQALGTNFINGYGLVKHIYGEVSSNIYVENGNTLSVYAPMSTASRTGEKVNILLYAFLDVGGAYGFVYQADFAHGYPGSNEGRFLYMDSKTLMKDYTTCLFTAQHEFSHAISFTQKTLLNGVAWTYWYGELLAMTCEDMMQNYFGVLDTITDKNEANNIGSSPKGRLSRGNEIASFNGLTGVSSVTYAAAFKFSAWLTRNFGGVKLIKEMAQNAYVDMDSILRAVNTVNGTNYTAESLLQKFAGDQLEEATNSGMNKDAPTYSGQSAYTCSYGASQTYDYLLTAINLWGPFYGWCNTISPSFSAYIANETMPFTDLPTANIYRDNNWGENTPTIAYKGPLMLNAGNLTYDIGPYESALVKIGRANSNSVTLNFKATGTTFKDTVTIWVK